MRVKGSPCQPHSYFEDVFIDPAQLIPEKEKVRLGHALVISPLPTAAPDIGISCGVQKRLPRQPNNRPLNHKRFELVV